MNNGLGAALHGGRWNRVGTEVIYTSTSVSLAALEILVHFDILPRDFMLTEILLPVGAKVRHLKIKDLPIGWDSEVAISETQDLGETWVDAGLQLALSVPSSIVPWERNFVINARHSNFSKIRFGPSVPFRFDSRLKK